MRIAPPAVYHVAWPLVYIFVTFLRFYKFSVIIWTFKSYDVKRNTLIAVFEQHSHDKIVIIYIDVVVCRAVSDEG